MKNLFVYGTLRYVPLLSCVLGRPAEDLELKPARLSDWAVFAVTEGPFPMIQSSAGAQAEGLVIGGLSDRDLARLNFYEGGFDYSHTEVSVATDGGNQSVSMYVPAAGRWTPKALWDLSGWIAEQGALTLEAAREVMELYGTTSTEVVDQMFPWIRARAWSRLLACEAAPQTLRSDVGREAFTIEAEHQGYDGFFRIKSFSINHKRFDGHQSATLRREAFLAFDAALVLPYDPVTDYVMLIEQLRFGPIWRGDPAPFILEPIAGLVDAGETPADCARREAQEETGLILGDLRLMNRVYASPGYSTEFFHCYLGICDLSGSKGGLAGKHDEHEDIRNHVISFDQAMALIDSGEVNAGPLTMMLLWLARHRDDLRRAAGVTHS